jgi:predicted nucleotide-binding protein
MLDKPHAALRGITREEARDRLQARIDQGRSLLAAPIRSADDLKAAIEEERKWRAYNVEMLSRMYTTDEYAREYGYSKTPLEQVGDHYFDVTRDTYISRLTESRNGQIAKLESFIERLVLIDEASVDQPPSATPKDQTKVFVVHGHDEGALQATARFLETIGLKAIVLREQPDQGRTVIEKFEACAAEIGFAVALLTPDDLGGAAADETQKSRARQNVIFELGYFVGSLGRGRACLLRKGQVEIPSDLAGVIYTDFDHPAEGWKIKLARELKAAGFKFDPDKVLA